MGPRTIHHEAWSGSMYTTTGSARGKQVEGVQFFLNRSFVVWTKPVYGGVMVSRHGITRYW